MILREYQENLITNVARKIAAGKRKPLVQMATGGGKTIAFAAISNRYKNKSGNRF